MEGLTRLKLKLYYFNIDINKPLSSRGQGHLPFTEETGIRIPLRVAEGKMSEWSIVIVLKTIALAKVPWVRIPLFPFMRALRNKKPSFGPKDHPKVPLYP
jgi:hypothetical protein